MKRERSTSTPRKPERGRPQARAAQGSATPRTGLTISEGAALLDLANMCVRRGQMAASYPDAIVIEAIAKRAVHDWFCERALALAAIHKAMGLCRPEVVERMAKRFAREMTEPSAASSPERPRTQQKENAP